MNSERIKELDERATIKIRYRVDPNTYKEIDDPDGDFERVEFDKEKFAELIVQECIDIAHDYDARKLAAGPGRTVAGMIEQHFGVEE